MDVCSSWLTWLVNQSRLRERSEEIWRRRRRHHRRRAWYCGRRLVAHLWVVRRRVVVSPSLCCSHRVWRRAWIGFIGSRQSLQHLELEEDWSFFVFLFNVSAPYHLSGFDCLGGRKEGLRCLRLENLVQNAPGWCGLSWSRWLKLTLSSTVWFR